jgi:hypothetical protein
MGEDAEMMLMHWVLGGAAQTVGGCGERTDLTAVAPEEVHGQGQGAVGNDADNEAFGRRQQWVLAVGGPAQDLSKFQMAPIPILSVLTCSTS